MSTERSDTALMQHWSTRAGVFLISLSLVLTELLLTRVFSVLFMYHFAFMVISLALFGLGVGGIGVYLFPDRWTGDLQRRLVGLTLGFAAALMLLVLFLFNIPLAATASLRGTVTVAAVYVMSSLPFFFGGTCLSLLLSRAGDEVSRLYFVDLLGAGAGCLLIIPALNHLGGVTGLLSTGIGAALAGVMFAWPSRRMVAVDDAGRLLQRTLLVIGIVLGLGVVVMLVAEPAMAWIGHRVFHRNPVYATRGHSFGHYFETQVQPEIRRIVNVARLPFALAWVGAVGGLISVMRLRTRATGRAQLLPQELRLAAGATLLVVAGFVVLNAETNALRVRFPKGHVESQNLFEGWNSLSRIAVFPRRGDLDNAYAWGLSPRYDGPPGEQLALEIDSVAGTPLVKFDGDAGAPGLEHLGHDITALAYTLRPARKTLVIGPGGGRDVLTALKFGSRDVNAVELNPIMAEVVNERFGDFTGRLYQRPDVHLTLDDGRHFVRKSADRFGVIQLALVDTWASTAAGAFALSENTLYTTEAFVDYLSHLEPDGVLTVTRWLLMPPRETLRVVSLTRAAFARLGLGDLTGRILVAGTPPLRRGHRFASVVISLRPFTAEEIAAAKDFVDRMGFEILYLPGTPRDPIFSELITTTDMPGFLRRYDLDVSPTNDDRPFFFNTVKPRDFPRFWDSVPGRMGTQLLARLVLVVTGLVALFMIGPLYLRRRSVLAAVEPGGRWSTLFYFGALGAGFMLIEVSLISKFVLFLGPPIYALTVVLCSLLMAAGCGSYWSGRHVGESHADLQRVIGLALAAIVALALLLELVFVHIVGQSFVVSALLTIATLAPVGFLMGMPFPLGLRLLDRTGPQWGQLIPWVWGINGATSVLGSVVAISLAINFGFRATLFAGLCIYGIAFAAAGSLAGGARTAAAAERAETRQRASGGGSRR